MDNPDSPDSLASDQLTVDLLSPASKRRRLVIVNDNNDTDNNDEGRTPDIVTKNNNNDVGFVLMEDDVQENGQDDDDEVSSGKKAEIGDSYNSPEGKINTIKGTSENSRSYSQVLLTCLGLWPRCHIS